MKKLLLFCFLLVTIGTVRAQYLLPWSNNYATYSTTGDIWRTGNTCFYSFSEGVTNQGLLFSSSGEGVNSYKWSTYSYGLTMADRSQLRLSSVAGSSWRSNPIVLSGAKGLALRTDNAALMLHENGIVSIGLNNNQFNTNISQLSDKAYDGYWGTVSSGYMLYVKQGIVTEKLKVSLIANWPDYVFKKDYTLTPLSMVEQHIKEKGYLHKSKSAEQIEKDGIEVAETAKAQQEKIEELFLHLIDMDKRLKTLEAENAQLKVDLDNNKK
jgi:hypothetical protein